MGKIVDLLVDVAGEKLFGGTGWAIIGIILDPDEPNPVMTKLSEVQKGLTSIESWLKDSRLSDKMEKISIAASDIRKAADSARQYIENPSDTGKRSLDKLVISRWKTLADGLRIALDGRTSVDSAISQFAQSPLDMYSDKMIAEKESVKKYAEALLTLAVYVVDHFEKLVVTVDAVAEHLLGAGGKDAAAYKHGAENARELCTAYCLQTAEYIRSRNEEAFRLYANLWSGKRAERCYIVSGDGKVELETITTPHYVSAPVNSRDDRRDLKVSNEAVPVPFDLPADYGLLWKYTPHSFWGMEKEWWTRSNTDWELIPEGDTGSVRIRPTSNGERYLAGPVSTRYDDLSNIWLHSGRVNETLWRMVVAPSPHVLLERPGEGAMAAAGTIHSHYGSQDVTKSVKRDAISKSGYFEAARVNSPTSAANASMRFRLLTPYLRSVAIGSSRQLTRDSRFDDLASMAKPAIGVVGAKVWIDGDHVRGVSFEYLHKDGTTTWCGEHTDGGDLRKEYKLTTVMYGRREVISGITYTANDNGITSLQFAGSHGKESELYGKQEGQILRVGKTPGHDIRCPVILGFYGVAGDTFSPRNTPALRFLGIHWDEPAPRRTRLFGSGRGTFFDDLICGTHPVRRMVRIIVHSTSDRIHGLQAEYELYGGDKVMAPLHGKEDGTKTEFVLPGMSHLVTVEGEFDNGLRGLHLRQSGPVRRPHASEIQVGREGHYNFRIDGKFLSLYGRSDRWIDALGLHDVSGRFTPAQTPYCGGGGGSWFDDLAEAPAQIAGISEVTVWVGPGPSKKTIIRGFCATYTLVTGNSWKAPLRGRFDSNFNEHFLKIDPTEDLARIEVHSNDRLHQVCFYVAKKKVEGGLHTDERYWRTPGPHGGQVGQYASWEGPFLGFFGRAGADLDGLGAYIRPSRVQNTHGSIP